MLYLDMITRHLPPLLLAILIAFSALATGWVAGLTIRAAHASPPPAPVTRPCEPLKAGIRAVEEYRVKWDRQTHYDVHSWYQWTPMPASAQHDGGGGIVLAYVTGARGGVALVWRDGEAEGEQCILAIRSLPVFEIWKAMTPEERERYRVGWGDVL